MKKQSLENLTLAEQERNGQSASYLRDEPFRNDDGTVIGGISSAMSQKG